MKYIENIFFLKGVKLINNKHFFQLKAEFVLKQTRLLAQFSRVWSDQLIYAIIDL